MCGRSTRWPYEVKELPGTWLQSCRASHGIQMYLLDGINSNKNKVLMTRGQKFRQQTWTRRKIRRVNDHQIVVNIIKRQPYLDVDTPMSNDLIRASTGKCGTPTIIWQLSSTCHLTIAPTCLQTGPDFFFCKQDRDSLVSHYILLTEEFGSMKTLRGWGTLRISNFLKSVEAKHREWSRFPHNRLPLTLFPSGTICKS